MEQLNRKEIYDIQKELGIFKDYQNKFIKKLNILKQGNNQESINKFLGGKTEKEWLDYYQKSINELQEKIRLLEKSSEVLVTDKDIFLIDKKTKDNFLREANIDYFTLKKILRRKKDKVVKQEILYTVYSPSKYGAFANSIVENITMYLNHEYPKYFNNLTHLLIMGDVKILSKTYVSIMIFTSFLTAFLSFLGFFIYTGVSGGNLLLGLVKGIPISFLGFLASVFAFYLYPYSSMGNRKKAIKNDLPFVIIHMAAIAGSGASPISIFNLILNSGEYKGLEGEIRKIVNYVNLFGYDLSTALRAVSFTTPSNDFKDLLTGIISSTETGGGLKSYLQSKASEALNTYRLERKKYVESLATYSDIYTGVLIAAPLLFMTTLAIIDVIGGSIGTLSVKSISTIGTFFVIPIMNIVFLVFLSVIQPETGT